MHCEMTILAAPLIRFGLTMRYSCLNQKPSDKTEFIRFLSTALLDCYDVVDIFVLISSLPLVTEALFRRVVPLA